MNGGDGPVRRVWRSGVVGILLAVGAFIYLVAYPPILGPADESYILYEAKRLWNGDAPYRDAPPHILAYPGDAWVYLALPADNPTPFCLLAGYNTPQQFDTAIARLRADPDAFVLVNWMLVKKENPIRALLDREYEIVRSVGMPGKFGMYGLNLFARTDRPSSARLPASHREEDVKER